MSRFIDSDFKANDKELLQSGLFADGTVICQGRTWKVHRALMASRLKFFKAAFCGQFVVRNYSKNGLATLKL